MTSINLPTWITISRLAAIPFLFWFLQDPSDRDRLIALGIFLLAAGTDWLDGYLARKLNQVTDLGKFLDPLTDKLLVFAPFLILVEWGTIPAWSVFLILARELAIAGWRVNQKTISGANIWGKLKTVMQVLAISLFIAPLPDNWQLFNAIVFGLAVALTLLSGIIYLWPKKE